MLSRRNFTQLMAAAAIPRIEANGLEIFQIRVNRRGNWILVRVRAGGLSGVGDASHGARDEVTVRYLRQLFELLRSQPAPQVESFRSAAGPVLAQGGRSAAVAFSALEQCLWDILGKRCGLPVCDLLGGRLRSEVRNYANINRSTEPRTPEGFSQMAERAVRAGFDAVKLAPFDDMPPKLSDSARIEEFTRTGIACAEAVRGAIGSKNDLLIDVHSRFDLRRGLELARRFEPLNLYWLEEVTPIAAVSDLAAINREAKMPTAGGEVLFGVRGFYPHVTAGSFDIYMPDVKYCGGVLELRKIAALCEAAGASVAPHGPASPVGNLAAAHVSATLPNFAILEYSFGEVPWRAELTDPPEQLERGRLSITDQPGFGATLNPAALARYGVKL